MTEIPKRLLRKAAERRRQWEDRQSPSTFDILESMHAENAEYTRIYESVQPATLTDVTVEAVLKELSESESDLYPGMIDLEKAKAILVRHFPPGGK